MYTTTSGEECTIKYVMTAVQTDLDSTVRHWGAVHEHTALTVHTTIVVTGIKVGIQSLLLCMCTV